MRKLIVILFVFLLTGCINGNRDFETICKKEELSEGFVENISYKVYFNDSNDITKLVEVYNLKYNNDYGLESFEAAKLSLKSYGTTKKYKIEVTKDLEREYEITFTLDISKMSNEELKKINFKRYYYDQMNEYKKDMSCSKN